MIFKNKFLIDIMCLAIPGKVVSKKGETAIVDFEGVKKEVNVSFVDCDIGDFVLVHVGFAIEKVDKDNAEYTIKLKEKLENEDAD